MRCSGVRSTHRAAGTARSRTGAGKRDRKAIIMSDRHGAHGEEPQVMSIGMQAAFGSGIVGGPEGRRGAAGSLDGGGEPADTVEEGEGELAEEVRRASGVEGGTEEPRLARGESD
jgi:hypothetical protein